MSNVDDKIALFRTKNFLLRNNTYFPLEQIGLGGFFERLFYRGDELHLQEMGYEHYYDRHYNAIVMTLSENSKGKKIGQNYIVTRELNFADKFWISDMTITSPVTYVGRNRNAKNARLCYGIAIDLDGVGEKQLIDVLHQQNSGYIPAANLIVNSGNGLHLYFLFEEPIALFEESKQLLAKFKNVLTETCWNMFTSTIKDKQRQGIFQGFRIPETRTKFGEKVTCFSRPLDSLPLYSVRVLSGFGPYHMRLKEEEVSLLEKARYFPAKISLAQAKKLYPDWYERRIVRGEARGRWHIKRDLYDWWLHRLRVDHEVKEGHRYFCVMSLATYALKCDIPYEELRADAYSLIDIFEGKTDEGSDNHFTEEDVEDALKAYEERYATFPRDTISKITGLLILPNKRNKQKQIYHLEEARMIRDLRTRRAGKSDWREGGGRPKGSVKTAETAPKAKIIREWRDSNPQGSKYACVKDTGLSKPTVYKWWDS